MRVLVTGATGFVGSRLVPALVEAGHEVTALVRDASADDARRKQYGSDRTDPCGRTGERSRRAPYTRGGVEAFEGDLLDPESLEGAFEGIDAAYYLVHSMRAGADFEERDRRAARNFSRAASGRVDRVVYLGGLGEERDRLSEHLRSRREVESILAEGEYDLTVLRAAIIVGAGSASFEMVRQLAARLPVMVTPRWVRTECQPIAIDDVVAYLVGVLAVPETAGGTYEIGGPGVMSYGEMLRRTSRIALGREPLVIPVPVLSPKLSAYWVDLVTDVPRHVAHPLVLGLKNPVVVHDDAIRDLVPIELTPFDEAVERALAGREP